MNPPRWELLSSTFWPACTRWSESWPRWPIATEPDKASESTPTCCRCCCRHWSIRHPAIWAPARCPASWATATRALRHIRPFPPRTVPTADRPIALAVGNDKQFKLLAEAVNLPWLADDSRFASNPQRVHNRDALAETLGAVLKTRGADYWYETLTSVGVPAGPINNVAEAFTFAEQLGLTVSLPVPASATPQVANPISLSGTPVSYRSAPPTLGDATPRE